MTSKNPVASSAPEKKDKKRNAFVRKQTKAIDGLSTARNTRPAVMTPDCRKRDPQKAAGIRNAPFTSLSSMNEEHKTPDKQAKLKKITPRTRIFGSAKWNTCYFR